MQVQSINNSNNTNFKAIINIKTKGKNFRNEPELIQPILEKIVPNEKYNFPERTVKVVAKSKDYSDFMYRMLYGITSDDPLINYNAVELLFYESLQCNKVVNAWKHIKGIMGYVIHGEYSKAYRDIAPRKIIGCGKSFKIAYEDLIHLLDIGANPSQHFQRKWYN